MHLDVNPVSELGEGKCRYIKYHLYITESSEVSYSSNPS